MGHTTSTCCRWSHYYISEEIDRSQDEFDQYDDWLEELISETEMEIMIGVLLGAGALIKNAPTLKFRLSLLGYAFNVTATTRSFTIALKLV